VVRPQPGRRPAEAGPAWPGWRPAGRAIAGGFAVALAVVVVFGAFLDSRPLPGPPVVVASHLLPAGTRLGPTDLRSVRLPLPPGPAGWSFRSAAGLDGRTLEVAVAAGEPLASDDLSPLGRRPSLRPIPLVVPADDLVAVGPGQDVDVLVTYGSAPSTRTSIVLRGATLVAVAPPAADSFAGGTSGEVVTLGVTSLAEVEALVAAEHAGSLDLVAAEPGDGNGLGPGPLAATGAGRGTRASPR